LFPVIEVLKDVFKVPGFMPSGMYGTAELNSLVGIFIANYVYYECVGWDKEDFWDKVWPLTYGDDVLMAVKEDVSEKFNTLTYREVVEDQIGMTFTASDKGEVSEIFIAPERASFLKRTFSYHPVLNRTVAKLELSSIYKTLEWRLPSDAITETDQVYYIIQSCLFELVLWTTKEEYDAFAKRLARIYADHYKCSEKEFYLKLFKYDDVIENLMAPFRKPVGEEDGSRRVDLQ
jgi:hypothetical protein